MPTAYAKAANERDELRALAEKRGDQLMAARQMSDALKIENEKLRGKVKTLFDAICSADAQPMKCSECSHWGEIQSERIIDARSNRECTRIAEADDGQAYINLYPGDGQDGRASLVTAHDFGCVLFEPKAK